MTFVRKTEQSILTKRLPGNGVMDYGSRERPSIIRRPDSTRSGHIINYKTFETLVRDSERPVILIEGTRALPAEDRDKLVSLATAQGFPEAVFRTGNAERSDEAFAESG